MTSSSVTSSLAVESTLNVSTVDFLYLLQRLNSKKASNISRQTIISLYFLIRLHVFITISTLLTSAIFIIIINCKTDAYGANVSICEDCGSIQIHYNSCRNRCCPMCQALPREKWIDLRREGVLDSVGDTPY